MDRDIEAEFVQTLGRVAILPSRGVTGSIRNSFRAVVIAEARRIVASEFCGDKRKFIDAIVAEHKASFSSARVS